MENIDYKFDQHLNNLESDSNKFNKYLNSQEFVNNNTKRIPVCIVVDCSGSMKEYDGTNKTRIDRVNDGIKLFYEKIRENIKTKKSVDVLIIQVGNEAKIIKDFSGTEKKPPKLNYLNEKNNLTEGVRLALDKLDERKKIYFAANIDYYQPWILIMSDGGLNKSFKKSEFRQIQQEVRIREMNCKLSVFPIYIQGKPTWNELEQKFVPIKPETYEERLTLMSEFSNSKERLINIDLADSSAFDGLFQFLHKSASSVANDKGLISNSKYGNFNEKKDNFKVDIPLFEYKETKNTKNDDVFIEEDVNADKINESIKEKQKIELEKIKKARDELVNSKVVDTINQIDSKQDENSIDVYINNKKNFPIKKYEGNKLILSIKLKSNDIIKIIKNKTETIYEEAIYDGGIYKFTIVGNKVNVIKPDVIVAKSEKNKVLLKMNEEIENVIATITNWDEI